MFKCGFADWNTQQWTYLTVSKRKLKEQWQEMYKDVIEKRPRAEIVMFPTELGLYTLERIN